MNQDTKSIVIHVGTDIVCNVNLFRTVKFVQLAINLQVGNEVILIRFIVGVSISQYDGHRDNESMGIMTHWPPQVISIAKLVPCFFLLL